MHGEGEGDNGDGDMREMMAVSLMGGGLRTDARMPPTKQGRKGLVDGGPKLAFSFSGGGGGTAFQTRDDGTPNPPPCLSQIYDGVLTFGHCCNVSSPSVS